MADLRKGMVMGLYSRRPVHYIPPMGNSRHTPPAHAPQPKAPGAAIDILPNPFRCSSGGADTSAFSVDAAHGVGAFHRQIPGYAPTPLRALPSLARYLGVADIRVKDESHRFGLNAFKVLGGSYALYRALCRALEIDDDGANGFAPLKTPPFRRALAERTCVTATDGNHGRAVAWAAREAGCRCVVHMPAGTSPARLDHVRRLGAAADVIDGNYDDAVRLAAREAADNGWLHIQDTAWEGYTQIPSWVMQGYLTLFDEALAQLGPDRPSHVFLQCGVGSFAAAGSAHLVARCGPARPRLVVVEAARAACFHKSVAAGDGRPHAVHGALDTIMAGLACGVPSTLAWEILRDHADAFAVCGDPVSCRGMRVLGNPTGNDPRIVSGESGAVGLGLLFETMRRPEDDLRTRLGLTPGSRILLVSTEGDTDPDMYRNIVWGGRI